MTIVEYLENSIESCEKILKEDNSTNGINYFDGKRDAYIDILQMITAKIEIK